jgi:hypothetical protein
MTRAELQRRRDETAGELDRLSEAHDRFPSPETRRALDAAAWAVNKIDVRLAAMPAST